MAVATSCLVDCDQVFRFSLQEFHLGADSHDKGCGPVIRHVFIGLAAFVQCLERRDIDNQRGKKQENMLDKNDIELEV